MQQLPDGEPGPGWAGAAGPGGVFGSAVEEPRAGLSRLIAALGSVSPGVHETAADALVAAGRSAVPALRWALRDLEYALRSRAAEVLVRIGEPALPWLAEAARDHDPEVRIWAIWALGRIGGAIVDEILGSLGPDSDPRVTRVWIDALGQLEGPCSLARLQEATTGQDLSAVVRSLEALTSREGAAAVPYLSQALNHRDGEVMLAAVNCLVKAGGTPDLGRLLSLTVCGPTPLRVEAIRLLGRNGSPEAIACLRQAAASHHPEITRAAVGALIETGRVGATVLCDLLSAYQYDLHGSAQDSIRGVAYEAALIQMGPAALPALLQRLTEGMPYPLRGWRIVGKIARRSPCPELRSFLPRLRFEVNRWGFWSDPTREELAAIRHTIEQATEKWKDLPVPASSPRPVGHTLPRTARPVILAAGNFPVPAISATPSNSQSAPAKSNSERAVYMVSCRLAGIARHDVRPAWLAWLCRWWRTWKAICALRRGCYVASHNDLQRGVQSDISII